MNVSNATASNKTSLPESGTKTSTENSQSKGFLETLTGVFTGSQKAQAKPVKSTTEVNDNASSVQSAEGERQEATPVDAEMSQQEELSEENLATDGEHDVTVSMDAGQQLLGRIEQANQTLSVESQGGESGKALPPESADWQATSLLDSQADVNSLHDDISADLAQRISIEELEVIDTKLAQGKPLTNQEVEILEGLKAGTVIAELAEEELALLVALPSEVKRALFETQIAQSNMNRQASASALTSEAVSPDSKYAALHAPTPEGNKSAIEQMTANTEASHKTINAALEAGSLKVLAEQQDKAELPQGLAGQLQAAVTQHGGASSQQARLDATQQAQVPLQLTKELANDQMAEKVQMMMSKNLKNLDIRLDPPELGRMQIRLTMNSDLANVHFTVTNPQARDIIEQTLPRLREMLAQQGMQLADSSVQQQNRGEQQGGYSTAEQNRQASDDGRGLSNQSDDGMETDIEMNVNVTSQGDGISYYA